jgi:hypothetical protein
MKERPMAKGRKAGELHPEEWLALDDPRCVTKPGVAETSRTMRQELPEDVVKVLRKHDLRIKLDRVVASRMFDQTPGMVSKDGCISAPSGPNC